jgi:two-component system, NtrC family, response regulator HydG
MSQARVLVVDDEVVVCRILDRMLSIDHYRVQSSHSVAEALAAIEANVFDLYVVDYKLRDGCGLDFVERIRSKGSEAPVILLSGYDPKEIALQAKDLRIFEILEKPFSREMIFNSVQKAMGATGACIEFDETHGDESRVTAISPWPRL